MTKAPNRGQRLIGRDTAVHRLGAVMIRKAVLWLVAAAIGALIAGQWQDLVRYTKIKQMSLGGGHPQNVPAQGSTVYPQDAAHGALDGTGDFESASRGGPAAA
jgi:hypothetical protein